MTFSSEKQRGKRMKPQIKTVIDLLMTLLLLFLMLYQVTGEMLHEWLGAGMLLLFLAHNLLNLKWYARLFQGSYRPMRLLQTLVNLGVLLSILCLGFSGAVLSRYVFAWLPLRGPMATARSMHMAASYWGFVLMSVHLGLHWGMALGAFRRMCPAKKISGPLLWGLRLCAAGTAGYGLYLFIRKDILAYMFLKVQFVFFDFEQSAGMAAVEQAAMMAFWVFVAYYAARGLAKLSLPAHKREETAQ